MCVLVFFVCCGVLFCFVLVFCVVFLWVFLVGFEFWFFFLHFRRDVGITALRKGIKLPQSGNLHVWLSISKGIELITSGKDSSILLQSIKICFKILFIKSGRRRNERKKVAWNTKSACKTDFLERTIQPQQSYQEHQHFPYVSRSHLTWLDVACLLFTVSFCCITTKEGPSEQFFCLCLDGTELAAEFPLPSVSYTIILIHRH